MPSFKRLTPLALFLTLGFFVSVASGESLKVATGEWRPYTSKEMVGYGEFTKRVSLVFKEMGVEPNYTFYPWGRCYDSVVKHRVWAAFPYSHTKERAKQVWFTDSLSCSKTVFFYYNKNGSTSRYDFSTMEDLKQCKVGGITGYFYEEIFKEYGLNIDYVSKEVNAMEKLKLGRIDLMPVNEDVGWQLIKTHFPEDTDNFYTLPKPLSVKHLRLIVSPGYPGSKELLDRFNSSLKTIVEKGIIQLEKCD